MLSLRLAKFALLALIATSPLLVANPVQAAARDTLVLAQNGPSLSEAVERVRRQYRGRIVSAETQTRRGREVHVIKVLTDDGKVKTVRIPGRSISRG